MASVFTDPSQFTPYVNPAGQTWEIPTQFAGAFNLPPPPDVTVPSPGATPAFDPAELATLAPPPQVLGPPLPEPAPMPTGIPPRVASAGAAPAPRAAPLPGPTPSRPTRAAPPQPLVAPEPTPLEDRTAAIGAEMAATQNKAAAAAALGEEEARIYGDADTRAAELEKARAEERKKEAEERGRVKADSDAATDRYVSYKVDESRRWNNLSTGSKIAAGIAVALSGLGNALARQGNAPNGALELIMGAIKDDVRLQMDERDQLGRVAGMKKDALGELRQQFGDNEAAYKAAVAGEYERAANQFRTAAASSKSDIAKAEGEIGVAHLMGEAGKLREEAANTEYARTIDQRNYRLQQSAQGLQRAQFAYQQDKDEADRAFRYTELGLRQDQMQADIAAASAKLAKEGQDKEAKEVRELAIGGFDRAPLKQQDGTIFKAPTPEAAIAIRKQVTAGAEAIRLVDQIKKLRADHGAEWGKTEAGRQLKANMAALQLEIKNTAELGVLAGPDMGLIESYVGSGDPTEFDAFGSIEKGLDEVRNNLRSKVQRSLETANFSGTWRPPDLSKIDTTKSDADKATEAIKGAKTPGQVVAAGKTSKVARAIYTPFGGETPRDVAARRAGTAAASLELPGASKEQEPMFKSLGMLAVGKDPDQAQRARQNLLELARDPNPETRTAALITMERAGLSEEVAAATAALPEKERIVAERFQAAASKPETVGDLEAALRTGDSSAMLRLAQIAREPGPMQKDAAAALIRARRGGR